jgi:hypothetical protein
MDEEVDNDEIMNVKKRIKIKKKIRMKRYCEDAGEEEASNENRKM